MRPFSNGKFRTGKCMAERSKFDNGFSGSSALKRAFQADMRFGSSFGAVTAAIE